jgi:diadenosine tetraphosphate (Ap4A) HIT family hydrolase
MTNEHCYLCGQIEGSEERNLIWPLLAVPSARRPVLAENAVGVVMPSLGALVPGHVLVMPKVHVRSFVSAPSDVQGKLEELTQLTRRALSSQLGLPVHMFEHGSSKHGTRVACSVEHAHRHLIPTTAAVGAPIAAAVNWAPVGQRRLRDIVGDCEYLHYQSADGESLAATAPLGGYESQLLRRLFATELRIPDAWNWRVHPQLENVRATIDLFATAHPVADHRY